MARRRRRSKYNGPSFTQRLSAVFTDTSLGRKCKRAFYPALTTAVILGGTTLMLTEAVIPTAAVTVLSGATALISGILVDKATKEGLDIRQRKETLPMAKLRKISRIAVQCGSGFLAANLVTNALTNNNDNVDVSGRISKPSISQTLE